MILAELLIFYYNNCIYNLKNKEKIIVYEILKYFHNLKTFTFFFKFCWFEISRELSDNFFAIIYIYIINIQKY